MPSGAPFIDFSRPEPSALLLFVEHARFGDVSVAQCAFAPNTGTVLGSQQLAIIVHAGSGYDLLTGQGPRQKTFPVRSGMINVLPANHPLYLAWGDAAVTNRVVAIEQAMVSRIVSTAGIGPASALEPLFGLRDRTINQLVNAYIDRGDTDSAGGKSFADGLATALVAHIYRTYGGANSTTLVKGGLTPLDAQRVITFIEQNLHKDIGLDQLASTVQLSTHYFTEAFRKTVGMPPYRFLLTRRIDRAKALLLNSDLSPGQIAEEVGFSSQPQLTTNFRKMVGKTPARFRREAS